MSHKKSESSSSLKERVLMFTTPRDIMMLVAMVLIVITVPLISMRQSEIVQEKAAVVVVMQKTMTPASSSTGFVHFGDMWIPVTNYHPAVYTFRIELESRVQDIVVEKTLYDSAHLGDRIIAEYAILRSGNVGIRRLRSSGG